ncbi:gamma-glutamyl-gamma-aminobutyrate hydrolase family protein [Fodinicurvata sp. EGI_FJ10296]|uniref:gamma-glutamyl-gamma-aminobutyrate hydrolase family protein n=1 Tax=Fodinicurvata sp. EGI_FJ10296 TaxID=3231908 RepID=UPI003452DD1C
MPNHDADPDGAGSRLKKGTSKGRPVVGIPCCMKQIGLHPFHIAGDKYIRAVADGAGALPFLIPALGDDYDWDEVLDRLDGILLTGSPSNVEPAHYQGPESDAGTLHDPARDATTLPLIRAAIDRGLPLLGICRGFQEINVALGGTLHQKVHEIPSRLDHRADDTQTADIQYGLAHRVSVAANGLLEKLFTEPQPLVNSVHSQGVDRLAPGLSIEATAPDGQIEAFRSVTTPGFVLAVQWHPEWRYWESPESTALFRHFGEVVRTARDRRPL